jgi:molybdopterin converting factor small subunit
MRVKAVFHGILSGWVGVPQAEFILPDGGTFDDLLSEVRKVYGPNMPSQLGNKGQADFSRAFFAVRGKERLSEPTTKLKDGEEIQFFLGLAGG